MRRADSLLSFDMTRTIPRTILLFQGNTLPLSDMQIRRYADTQMDPQTNFQHLFLCCLYLLSQNVFTEPLPSNDRRDNFTLSLSNSDKKGTYTQTQIRKKYAVEMGLDDTYIRSFVNIGSITLKVDRRCSQIYREH